MFESKQIDAQATALLQRMTLAEKVGQLTQFSNGDATGPDSVKIDQGELAARGGVGSMLNVPALPRAMPCSGRRSRSRG